MPSTPDVPKLTRKIRELEQRLRRLETRRVLPLSSIDSGRLQSGNYVEGESGWALFPDLIEVGSLRLRDGIIGNDALTSPVFPANIAAYENDVALSPTEAGFAGVDVGVPDGFSRVLAVVVGSVSAVNSTGSVDIIWCTVRINGVSSAPMPAETPPGEYGNATVASSYLNVPPPAGPDALGATVHIEARLFTSVGDWDPSGRAEISGVALFLR